jgi:hypothetical protein
LLALLKNLRETLERLLDRHASALRAITLPMTRRVFAHLTQSQDESVPQSRAKRSPRDQTLRQTQRERRQAPFAQVRDLHADGVSLREVAA